MSITSITFAIFMLVMLVGYYLIPLKRRWIWLLIGSAYFYISYNRRMSVWLLVSILLIYFFGLWINHCDLKYKQRMETADKAEKKQLKKDAKRIKGYIAFFCACIQIGIWVGFRLTNVFIGVLNNLMHQNFDLMDFFIPLGLSFYMLQAISYVVDLKRGQIEVQKNPFKLALWLGFFPQMIQGPIARYKETSEQLFNGNRFDWKNIRYGAQLMLWGYFKKLILANYSAVIVNTIFYGEGSYSGCDYVIGIVMYAIELYGDFSGGIDIITGCAEMLGIHLPENFRRPYFSRTIEEFWQRWHITLGTWFRDYLFYPISISKWANNTATRCRKLFGAKLGNMIPTYIALIIVWTGNGVWHGAGMGYFLFGFYNGVVMVLALQFNEPLGRWAERALHVNRERFSWRIFQTLRAFTLMCIGRIFFVAESVRQAFGIFKSFFTGFKPWVFFDGSIYNYGLNQREVHVLMIGILVLLVVSIMQESGIKIRDKLSEQNVIFRWIIYLVALFVVIIFGMYGAGYNASDFIYAQF